jgi:hypothetical protein
VHCTRGPPASPYRGGGREAIGLPGRDVAPARAVTEGAKGGCGPRRVRNGDEPGTYSIPGRLLAQKRALVVRRLNVSDRLSGDLATEAARIGLDEFSQLWDRRSGMPATFPQGLRGVDTHVHAGVS